MENHRRVCWQSKPKVRKQASPSAPSRPSQASIASLYSHMKPHSLRCAAHRQGSTACMRCSRTATPGMLHAVEAMRSRMWIASASKHLSTVLHCQEPARHPPHLASKSEISPVGGVLSNTGRSGSATSPLEGCRQATGRHRAPRASERLLTRAGRVHSGVPCTNPAMAHDICGCLCQLRTRGVTIASCMWRAKPSGCLGRSLRNNCHIVVQSVFFTTVVKSGTCCDS